MDYCSSETSAMFGEIIDDGMVIDESETISNELIDQIVDRESKEI